MVSATRSLIVAAAFALVILAGVTTAAPNPATTARGQTLFGMNAPSLDALDEEESALGARRPRTSPADVDGALRRSARRPDHRAHSGGDH